MRMDPKHQFAAQLVDLIVGVVLTCGSGSRSVSFAFSLHFLHSVGVPEGVESVFSARVGRAHVADHGCLTAAHERVFQDQGQFALSKLDVVLLQVECPDALFESEETFIDFPAFISRHFIVVYSVSASFTSGKIDKAHSRMDLRILTTL